MTRMTKSDLPSVQRHFIASERGHDEKVFSSFDFSRKEALRNSCCTVIMDKTKREHVQSNEVKDEVAWIYSFGAAMVPFTAFCVGHARGMTVKIVEGVVRSPVGVYGLLVLPFISLGMEKSIYDTVQAYQGIDPNTRPADRGGFPSGGACKWCL